MALFVKLDVTWLDSHKIVLAPMAVRGCHATALCIAKRTENDGWFPRVLLMREGADDVLITDMVARRLLEVDGDLVRPYGWLKRNTSQAAIEAKKQAKALAGLKGNHERWHSGDFDHCGPCQAKKAEVIAGCETGAIAPSSHPDRNSSPETYTETEEGADRKPSQAAIHPGFAGPRPVDGIESARSALRSVADGHGATA